MDEFIAEGKDKMPSTDKQNNRFLFSVIMPVYNTELFLREAVDSVINQTLGFRENIQIIFINDASTDSSHEICESYKKQFPDNIVYYELEKNSGVSVARNKGIEFIEGEFVAFFDSDDIWPEDAFEKAYRFFCEHNDEIDVISCRMRFFGYKDDYFQGVDGKFSSGIDRVVDLREECTALHHGVSSSFIRATCVKAMRFDSSLTSGDDSKFLNTVILQRLKYGLLASVEYMYRKHSRISVVSKRYHTKNFYLEIDRTLQYFIDLSTELYGEVVRFIQFLMIYNISSRMLNPIDTTILTEQEVAEYKDKIKRYLSYIDDDIIESSPYLHRAHKIFAMGLKHEDLYETMELRNKVLYYHDTAVFSLRSKKIVKIDILDVEGDVLKLYGSFDFKLQCDENAFYFSDGENNYHVAYDQYTTSKSSLGEEIYKQRGYSVEIPIKKDKTVITARIDYRGETIDLNVDFREFVPIGEFEHSYFQKDELLVKKKKSKLIVHRETRRRRFERKYLRELIKGGYFSMACLRVLVILNKKFLKARKKEIWLFGDRIYLADDNGEFFYDYVQSRKNPRISSYYMVTDDSQDLSRMKKKARCLIYNSFKYEMMLYLAKYCLVSVRRLPPGKYDEFFRDMRYETIYLKHGIDGTDVSRFVSRLKVNDRVYLASSKGEYESCISGNYGYTEREIKLTGLARDDLLYQIRDESKKIICIAPTWRMYMALPIDLTTQRRDYDTFFRFSEYYQFYNSLINDERLLKVMREHNYTGIMQLHPNLMLQADDFETNDVFTLQDTRNKRFVEKYQGVDLCLTDYSSIAFEYALMGRSVIYAQFDKEKFYQTQYKEGYYDFERDGFGPVCYNLEDTIDALIEAIENDCRVEEKYAKRRDEYFGPFDGRNCERIYDMIMNL